MKVAILCESPADQAAVQIFVDALLGQKTELHDRREPLTGWTGVFTVLEPVFTELYYKATDVDALAVVVDSDLTTPHVADHDRADGANLTCRLCRLRQEIRRIRSQLPATQRKAINVAVGLAIPSMEAWLQCGRDNTVTEAAWLVALRERRFAFDPRRLKLAVYGRKRITGDFEKRRMVEEASRLAADVQALEKWFPGGFGPFAADIRGWLGPTEQLAP
jgi:hypothetical protein